MSDRRVIFAIALSFAGAASICCADPALEDVTEQHFPIAATARISVRNGGGSIRVYGADTKELKIQAIKKAYSADRLKQIAVNITVGADEVSIDTKFPPKPRWGFSDRSGTVDYIIVLPQTCSISDLELSNGEVLVEGIRGRDVHATLGSGRMFGHNCFGDLHLNVTDGGIDVGYDWWETWRGSIDARVVNGNARVFMPVDAAFHLIATAINGHIANDFAEKRDRVSGDLKKIDTVIGGDSELNLQIHATNGSIQITEVNL
ncbi:MAG: hypothetical protein QOG67_2121 [Verrucomicrobiota bacterium]|jgi:hypothetical protein